MKVIQKQFHKHQDIAYKAQIYYENHSNGNGIEHKCTNGITIWIVIMCPRGKDRFLTT